MTRDIDALVSIEEPRWEIALRQAQQFGFCERIDDAVAFARRSRVLLLRHVATEIEIDLVLSALPFEQDAVDNARLLEIEGIAVSLPRVEDLLIMKAIAHRPRDLSDIEGLIDANPNIDLELVKRWVREFSIASTMPDMIADFEKIVATKGR